MTREEIEKAANEYSWSDEYLKSNSSNRFQNIFIAGAMFVLRTQLEKKRQAYIDKIGYEPSSPNIEDWSLQIDLLTKRIEEL